MSTYMLEDASNSVLRVSCMYYMCILCLDEPSEISVLSTTQAFTQSKRIRPVIFQSYLIYFQVREYYNKNAYIY